MSKQRRLRTKQVRSKLDPFAARLDKWFTTHDKGGEGLTFVEGHKRLRQEGLVVSLTRLRYWWHNRQLELRADDLMKLVVSGAQQTRNLDAVLSKNPAPHIDTLIALFKVLIIELTTKGVANPQFLKLSDQLAGTATQLIHTQARAVFWERQQAIAEQRLAEWKKSGQLKALEDCLNESEKFPEVQELFRTAFTALRQAREA